MRDERVFDGLKVPDWASFIAAPAAATVMSDFGAEVIGLRVPAGRVRPAAAVGEYSQEVLLAAGYSEPEIHSTCAAGVIG